LSKKIVFKETRGVSVCKECGGSVTLREWFVEDEQGRIEEMHSAFLYVCESCGHGSELEARILDMLHDLVAGRVKFDENDNVVSDE